MPTIMAASSPSRRPMMNVGSMDSLSARRDAADYATARNARLTSN